MKIFPLEHYGYDFIPCEYLPEDLPFGADEYWLRNAQQAELLSKKLNVEQVDLKKFWRNVTHDEIETLKKNRNYCSNWENFLVKDPFNPSLIRDSKFYGLVRLGTFRNVVLKHHDFCLPAGIYSSTIIASDIGDDTAIHDCAFISHYIIGDNCIISRVDELQTTNHAKFGNGTIKSGETEERRIWIDVMNEAGGRSILPFESMIAADAYLWAAYRDDITLTKKLAEITQKQYGGFRGAYGTIGNGTVIKSCSIIKDVAIGAHAYIKGANKLKNLTIHSSAEEPTQIGEGVELVNGIIGFACKVFYGCKAVRFVLGRNSNLKYGARLIHSVLGDNSTVSCCEILNNLIFPIHEQHHNNSFLIASLIQGMSNMAAAATLGSNHNSRANDGEIRAGRGFWPGLAVSLKHSSCFASYTLIANGKYISEINNPLPFSLINNNVHKNRFEIMPAYFWMHNLYALERTVWKAKNRDKRKIKIQRIETDYLAPDTAEEILTALSLLNGWLGESGFSQHDCLMNWMTEKGGGTIRIVHCRHLENSKRAQVVIKPLQAIAAYRQMLRYYAVKTIAAFFDSQPGMDYRGLCELLNTASGSSQLQENLRSWVNTGGQIVPAFRVDELRKDIGEGKYKNWDEIHHVYDLWNEAYQLDKCRHAWIVLGILRCTAADASKNEAPDAVAFKQELAAAKEIRSLIDKQVFEGRKKDRLSPFRKSTFRNQAELEQILGKPGDNPFVRFFQKESSVFYEMIERVSARL